MRERADAAACPGCLDSGRCWVCLGQGSFEVARAVEAACHACNGSGVCSRCEPAFVQAVFLRRYA
jgi:hypothetical protein